MTSWLACAHPAFAALVAALAAATAASARAASPAVVGADFPPPSAATPVENAAPNPIPPLVATPWSQITPSCSWMWGNLCDEETVRGGGQGVGGVGGGQFHGQFHVKYCTRY